MALANDLKQLEKALADQKKKLEAAEAKVKKTRLEYEGAEKVVTLAKESRRRAREAVERRKQELSAAELESKGYADRLADAEETLAQAELAADEESAKAVRVAFADSGETALLLDERGRLATFAVSSGRLLERMNSADRRSWAGYAGDSVVVQSNGQITRFAASRSWKLVKQIWPSRRRLRVRGPRYGVGVQS